MTGPPSAGRAGEATLRFSDAATFAGWLAEHHASATGVRIEFAKRETGVESVPHEEALRQALRFGWIDAQVGSGPAGWFRQRFTPRRARSRWSKRNCDLAEELIARGEMEPAGLAAVEAAKADGRWAAAYAGPRTAAVPGDLQRELDADPEAGAFFAGLTSQNRYAILYRLEAAKRPETRARRLATFMEMLRRGETLH
ncbi:MAG: YdeI/OmpD-associated family protein [Candidatus Dormibacteraceae bacterium]